MMSHLLPALLTPKALVISDAQTYLQRQIWAEPYLETNIGHNESRVDDPCGHRLLLYCVIAYAESKKCLVM
ncbi:hypothetical protein F4774DRAFT_365028, partial [Daldinia eschscholtzii]